MNLIKKITSEKVDGNTITVADVEMPAKNSTSGICGKCKMIRLAFVFS